MISIYEGYRERVLIALAKYPLVESIDEAEQFVRQLSVDPAHQKDENTLRIKKAIQSVGTDKAGSQETYCKFPDGTQRWMRAFVQIMHSTKGIPLYASGKRTDIQDEVEEKRRLNG